MLYMIGWGSVGPTRAPLRWRGSVGGVGRGKVGKIYTNRLIIVKNRLLILVTIEVLKYS